MHRENHRGKGPKMAEEEDVFYGTGVYYVVPLGDAFGDENFRGIVSMDHEAYKKLAEKGLMDQEVQVTLVNDDNYMTDTEGWDGKAGLRTIKVHNLDPKAELLLGREDLVALTEAGIVDGNIVDVTIAKI